MSTLQYAILGLLNQKPRSGYDLSKEFESTLNEFWSAKHSQIYPELKRLTQENLVEFSEEIVGTSLKKKKYTITQKGKEEFMEWLEKYLPMPPTPKSEHTLQVFFFESLEKQKQLKLLEYHLQLHKDRLKHLKNNKKKFNTKSLDEYGALGDYLVLIGAIMREETNCKWLEECLKICKKRKKHCS